MADPKDNKEEVKKTPQQKELDEKDLDKAAGGGGGSLGGGR
jgi:hypothetical protein